MGAHQGAFWRREPVIAARKTPYRCQVCSEPAHLDGIGTDLAKQVAIREFGVTWADLVSRRRADDLVRGRAFVTWALRALGEPMSYPVIGMALGGRDHTTVINLHQKAIWLRLVDPAFADACNRLAGRFYHMRRCRHGN